MLKAAAIVLCNRTHRSHAHDDKRQRRTETADSHNARAFRPPNAIAGVALGMDLINARLIGAVGIEPTTFGLKGHCSTAELRP